MSCSLFFVSNLTLPHYSSNIPVSIINMQICQLLICSLKGIIRKIILPDLIETQGCHTSQNPIYIANFLIET